MSAVRRGSGAFLEALEEVDDHVDALLDGLKAQEFALGVEAAAGGAAAVDDGNAGFGHVVAVGSAAGVHPLSVKAGFACGVGDLFNERLRGGRERPWRANSSAARSSA